MQRIFSLVVAGLLVAGSTLAAEAIDFDRYDENGDGHLTDGEWTDANTGIAFDIADTNRDGYVDEAEAEAAMSMKERNVSDHSVNAAGADAERPDYAPISDSEDQQRAVVMYDDDSDGRVSRSEARKDGELVTYFVIWDTNQDGYLDQSEIDSGERETGGAGSIDRSDAQAQSRMQHDATRRPENSASPRGIDTAAFDQADTDHDDRISRSEATGVDAQAIAASFDALDANRDGYVDRDEASASPQDATSGANTPGAGGAATVQMVSASNNTGTAGQFTTLDENGDGLLDETEAAEDEYVLANFDAWDEDRDGFVSEDEASKGWVGNNDDDVMGEER